VPVLYDVLNKYVIDGALTSLYIGELVTAIKHLDYTKKKDLVIYDRIYPSFQLVYEHHVRETAFLVRVKKYFNNKTHPFYEKGTPSEIIKIRPGKNKTMSDKPYNKESSLDVRLVRVLLSNGES
jgi:hypothetical protein